MAKFSDLLNQRFLKKEKSKMATLAEKSSEGSLSSFSGIFKLGEVSDKEKKELENLLLKYANEDEDISSDLSSLLSITSEVKAIQNQAAILHGERIKKAQEILKKYRDGAFTAWMLTTYGNRQTPYNFLQYYEFFKAMPKGLHPQIETMPRQAIYTLASREVPIEEKEKIIRSYNGESKEELLFLIRSRFPLDEGDKRGENHGQVAIQALERMLLTFEKQKVQLLPAQKQRLSSLLHQLKSIVDRSIT
jgi:hypothetical protein